MPGLVVLLPCLNEARNLPGLFSALEELAGRIAPQTALTVLVVDDGSTDETARLAAGYQGPLAVELVSHGVNKGLGAALQTGIAWFVARFSDSSSHKLAVMDADGTHPPQLLAGMLAVQADIVIASRYAPGGEEHGLPGLRRFYSRAASGVLRLIAPVAGARDYTCGYRLYSGSILIRGLKHYSSGLVTERGFVCMAELLVKLGRLGARVAEVPLKLHYELKGGPSKLNVPATISRYILLGFRVLFSPAWR